jgi:hypothetical protein
MSQIPGSSLPTPAPAGSRISSSRRPRLFAKINGSVVDTIAIMVENCAAMSADKFEVELQAWGQQEGFDIGYFQGVETPVMVEIWGGFLADADPVNAIPQNANLLIKGKVDEVRAPLTGGNLSLSGRDMTSTMLDQTHDGNFTNQTASQVVTTLANQAGLIADVTATTSAIGSAVENAAYTALSLGLPLWQIASGLAVQEGFDVFVKGDTLFFHPPNPSKTATSPNPPNTSSAAAPAADTQPLNIWITRSSNGAIVSNATRIEWRRSLTLDDPFVKVRSTNIPGATAVTATAGSSASPTQTFQITKPNLTGKQAKQLSQSVLASAQRHSTVFEVEMEADFVTDVRMPFVLSGTGTPLDGTYRIDTITRNYSFGGGFSMHIRAITPPTPGEVTP